MKIKVGNITKIKTGKLDANASSPDGKYPFFTCSKEPLKINSYSYDCECVLVAGNGDLNVKYFNGKFDAYQRTYIIEDNSNGLLHIPYLYYFLENYIKELRKQSIGGVIKYIKLENLTEVSLELPTIAEQKRIVSIMETCSKLLISKNNVIEKMDLLTKARFVEMFGDPIINPYGFPVKKIDEVAALNKGITYSPDDISKEGIIVLRSGNIKGDAFDLEDIVRISKKISNDKLVNENDILMCNRNGSVKLVGKVAKIPKLEEKMTFGTFMTIVRSDIFEYLFVFFQTSAFREQIKFQTAVAINQISLPLLASVKVPIPTNELIKEFADFVHQVDKSKLAVQQSLEKTQQLFDSLMQEYFG